MSLTLYLKLNAMVSNYNAYFKLTHQYFFSNCYGTLRLRVYVLTQLLPEEQP